MLEVVLTSDPPRRPLFPSPVARSALSGCAAVALLLQGCLPNDYYIEDQPASLPESSNERATDASSPDADTTSAPSTDEPPEPSEPPEPIATATGSASSCAQPANTLTEGGTEAEAARDAGGSATSSDPSEPPLSEAPDAAPETSGIATTPTSVVDAGGLPPVPPCERYSTYEDPQPFRGLGLEGLNVWSPSLTADRLELFVAASTTDDEMIYVAHRSSPEEDFSAAEPIELNSPDGRDGTPAISADGLTIAFYSTRASESRDLWLATRPSRSEPFAEPMALDELNTTEREHLPWLSADGMTLLYTSDGEPTLGGRDIRIAVRTALDDPFIGGVPLANVNSELNDDRAALNASGLIVYFSSERDNEGDFDMYYASREDLDSDFGEPTRLLTQNLEIIYVSDGSGENEVLHAFRTCLE
jgi:WD40-like Beta Propeller Repeat